MTPRRISRNLYGLSMLLVGAQCCIHLLQGSDLVCTTILALTLLLAVSFVRVRGLDDTMVWITLYAVARFVWIASLVKICLGQPIDSNLRNPITSFAIVLIYEIQIILAYFFVKSIRFRRVLLEDCKDIALLARVSVVSFLIAVPACILTQFTAKEDLYLSGFRAFYDNTLLLAIITRVAYVSLRHENRRLLDGPLALMLATSVVLAMLVGMKILAFDAC